MGRNKEYTSDAVKDSVQAAMAEITAYFDKNWAPGREYDVIKHVHSLLDAEIDKYVAPAEAGNAYRHLAVFAPGSKKYAAVHARNLEKYGPYLMELFVEYADSLKLTGRYDVGERYNEVSRDVLDKMQKDFLSKENIEKMIDSETDAIDLFMKQHGVEDYSITMGSIGLAVIVTEEVGGTFDCSNNQLTSLANAPKVVGGHFICEGNAKAFTYTEIKNHTRVGGRIYTGAPLTKEEKEDFRQRLIKEQDEFLAQYRSVGNKLEKAIEDGDIKTIEECREYFYDAIPFFKERPWIKKQGMELSHDILMKIYVHLNDFDPYKYPDITAEEFKLRKLLRD